MGENMLKFRNRIFEAQSVPFPDIRQVVNEEFEELISSHADSIGCPQEFLFVPFLTATAGKIYFCQNGKSIKYFLSK
jgi:hypothetical protein